MLKFYHQFRVALILCFVFLGSLSTYAQTVYASSLTPNATNVTYTFSYKTSLATPANVIYMNWPSGFSIPNPTPCVGGQPWNQTSNHVTLSINGSNVPGPWLISGCGWNSGVQINLGAETPANSNVVVQVTGVTNGSNPGSTSFTWSTRNNSGQIIEEFSNTVTLPPAPEIETSYPYFAENYAWNNFNNTIGVAESTSGTKRVDVNNDGIVDVAYWTFTSAGVLIFKDDGSFTNLQQASPGGSRAREFADVDGDGDYDFLRSTVSTIEVSYCSGFNNGIPVFGNYETLFTQGSIFSSDGPYGMSTGDLNNDGKLDIIIAGPNGPNRPRILIKNVSSGYTMFELSLPTHAAPASPGYFSTYMGQIVVNDFDNDGDLDLIIPEAYCDIYLYKNNGSASFTSSIIVDEPTNSFNNLGSWLEVVDLNNDGKKDMILSTSLGNTSKAYFYINTSSNNSGPYTFVKTVTPSLTGANYLDYAFFGGSRSTIFEDIDGNGVKDVYCAINGSSTDRFTGWVKLFIDGSNNVTFTKHPIIHLGPLTSAEPNGRYLLRGDMNGDNKLDYLVTYPNSNSSRLLYYRSYFPAITQLGTAAVNLNNRVFISGAATAQLTLAIGTDNAGIISVSGASGGSVSGSGTASVTITGTTAQINNSLATILYTPSVSGTHTLTYTVTNSGGQTFTNTQVINANPMSVSTTSLTGYGSCLGSASSNQSVAINAQGITGSVLVTAPTGYEVSTSLSGPFSSSLTLTPTNGNISSANVVVRLSATASLGTVTGNLTVVNGSTTLNVALSGMVMQSAAGTISGSNAVCSSGATTTLTLTGHSGAIVWQRSSTSSGPWTIISGATTSTLTTPSITGTTYFRAQITNFTCPASTTPVFAVSVAGTLNSLSAISGSSSLSSSATTATYSVPAVAGATGYVWDLPVGMTLTSQTGPSVTVAVSSTFTSGTIRVKALNSCSESPQRSLTVTKAPLVTFSLTGSTTLCPDTQQVYTATSVSGGTYVWTVPSTVTIVSGQGTNSLTIAPTASFVSGQVKVVCTTGSTSQQASLMVSGTTQPSVITGPSNICGLTTATYSVVETAGVSYQWTLPEGMSIVSGGNSSSITVSISGGSVSGLLSVRSVSSCGISLPRTMTIGSTPILGTIAGSTVVCGAVQATIDTNGQILNNNPANQYVYKVSLVPGVTSYQWTVPSGATLVSGQGSNIILVSYDLSSFNSGIISVQGVNSCGTGVARTLSVSTVSGSISGPATICGLTTATYSVPSDLGNNFVWTLPQGMTITGGSGTSSITVGITHPIDFTSGNQVSVSFTTACGGSKTLNFTVSCNDYTKLTASYCGATSISPSQWLFVNAVPGATSYKYNVYDATGANLVFSTERSVTYFRFLEHTFTYGATYKVRVQAKIGGVYGIEGVACSVTIQDANAALQAAYCGATNVTPSQWLFVNNVVGATAYKYNVYDATGTNLVFSTERSVNFFRFLENTFAYGTTYQVRVQVKQGDSYGVEGSACSVTIQGLPTTSLATSSCGASNVTPYQLLYANSVAGATGYKFNVYDEAGTTLMFSQERSVPNFRFLDSPFVYGQIYQVKVQVKQGNTYGSEGSSCSVLLSKMPITSLVASQCNSTINTSSDIIYATAVAGVASYRFTIYDSNSTQVAQIERPNNYFKLNDFAYVAGVTYSVAVATKQEGQAYGLNGGLCTISTPAPGVRVTAVGEGHKVDASDVEGLAITLYPNPFQRGFVIVPIATDLGAKVSYEVFDLTGKLIESNVLNVEVVQNYTIGEEYARGMYIVHVKQGTTSQTFKMIKQ